MNARKTINTNLPVVEKDRSIELDEEEAKKSDILNTDSNVRKKKPASKLLGMDDNDLEKSQESMAFSQRQD